MNKIKRTGRIAVVGFGLLIASTACAGHVRVGPENDAGGDNHYILECGDECRHPLAGSPASFYTVPTSTFALPDGRRLVWGMAGGDPARPGYSFAVERVMPDGAADPSFAQDGFAIVPVWGYYEAVYVLVVQPDGKLVLGGNAADPTENPHLCYPAFCGLYPALIRLNADGSVDRSFNGNGKIVIAIGNTNPGPQDVRDLGTLSSIAIDSDGKIVVYSGETAVARVNANGELDTSFAGTSQVAREVRFSDYEGLWYAAPAESEAGWGITLSQQGDTIYAVWYTFEGKQNSPRWYAMSADKRSNGIYRGILYATRGPRLDLFDPLQVEPHVVGDGALTFVDSDNGTFDYSVSGVTQSKKVTRQRFDTPPVCFGALYPTNALNYQGLWYAAPAESEAGWGVYLTHQGQTIFATWFTYDSFGDPLWLAGVARKTKKEKEYAGTLFLTKGPGFDAVPWKKDQVSTTDVGTFSLAFDNGASASFNYSVTLDPLQKTIIQSKRITRQVFSERFTICGES